MPDGLEWWLGQMLTANAKGGETLELCLELESERYRLFDIRRGESGAAAWTSREAFRFALGDYLEHAASCSNGFHQEVTLEHNSQTEGDGRYVVEFHRRPWRTGVLEILGEAGLIDVKTGGQQRLTLAFFASSWEDQKVIRHVIKRDVSVQALCGLYGGPFGWENLNAILIRDPSLEGVCARCRASFEALVATTT